jgi:flagellar basal body rod protein FlgF
MEKGCSEIENNANIKPENTLVRVYKLTVEITRAQGQINALQDETDKTTRANLDRIKNIRYEVKQKQKELKELIALEA